MHTYEWLIVSDIGESLCLWAKSEQMARYRAECEYGILPDIVQKIGKSPRLDK